MRNYKPSAHMVRRDMNGDFRFVHPRYDAAIVCGTLADLNAVLVEFGYRPVYLVQPGWTFQDAELTEQCMTYLEECEQEYAA